jgi:hypothetical protein
MAMDASIAQAGTGSVIGEAAEAADVEAALFAGVFEQVEAMVAWARSGQALGLEHDELEERVLADGHEVMRRLTEGHLALRAAREQRRGDVTDAEAGSAGECRVRPGAHQGHDLRAGAHIPDRLPQAR